MRGRPCYTSVAEGKLGSDMCLQVVQDNLHLSRIAPSLYRRDETLVFKVQLSLLCDSFLYT